MHHARNRSRARFGGLLALALGVAALLAIPVVSAARQGADDGPNHEQSHENGRHHRHHHHTVVGTIASFDADSGLLTIDLRRGGSVSGLVDRRTKIKCEDQEVEHHHNRGDDHGGGDNSGSGSGSRGHDDFGSGANCTTAALVAGADVQEADVEIEHGTRHFDEVELAH